MGMIDWGMFDWVNFEMNCPKCGTKVRGFQSKSYYCKLEKIDPDKVNRMYSECPKCDNWIELSRDELPEQVKARDTPFSLEEVKAIGFHVTKGL